MRTWRYQMLHISLAGAQKCGTTAPYHFLSEHPQMESSAALETHFFDWHYPSDVQVEEWLRNHHLPTDLPPSDIQCAIRVDYVRNFNTTNEKLSNGTIFFEKTPSYLFLSRTPELIAATCPWKPKIVVILRNSVNRAFSHFQMKLKTKGKSFAQLIDDEIAHLRQIGLSRAPPRSFYSSNDTGFQIPPLSKDKIEELHWRHFRKIYTNNYIQRGMYEAQLQYWLKYFALGESLIVLNYEKFKRKPQEVFSQLLDFVGARPFTPAEGFSTSHNKRGQSSKALDPEMRRYLTAFFQPYNDRLADLLGEEWRGVWK